MVVAGLMSGVLLLGGCGGGAGADGTATASRRAQPANQASPGLQAAPPAVAADLNHPGIPADAAYTIYCRDFTGPNHYRHAEQLKNEAARLTGLRDFYIVRGEGRSVLYHGFYRAFEEAEDPRDARRARRDRQLIDRLVTEDGRRIFPRTLFEPLARPDPAAPPEWDLRNARGFWTVVIAAYTDPALRKQAAVESVREARKMGIEAYYLHSESMSYVCIGTWPIDAIKQQEGAGNHPRINPDDPEVLIVSTIPLGSAVDGLRDARGRPVRVMQMKLEILDPTLEKVMREYNYAVDGYETSVPKPPLLLEIARATDRPPAIDEAPVEFHRPDTDALLQRPGF